MSKRSGANVVVTARECRGNHERMIRRFIKKCKKAKIIQEVRDRRYYKKPSDIKRHKKQAVLRKIRKNSKKENNASSKQGKGK